MLSKQVIKAINKIGTKALGKCLLMSADIEQYKNKCNKAVQNLNIFF